MAEPQSQESEQDPEVLGTGKWWSPGAPETSRDQHGLCPREAGLFLWADSIHENHVRLRAPARAEHPPHSFPTPSLIFSHSHLSIFLPCLLLLLCLLSTDFRLLKSVWAAAFICCKYYDRRGRNTLVISRAGWWPGNLYLKLSPLGRWKAPSARGRCSSAWMFMLDENEAQCPLSDTVPKGAASRPPC